MSEIMDEAWARVEAALPEGWWIGILELAGRRVETVDGRRDRLLWWDAIAYGPKERDAVGSGPTPTAALLDLASKFGPR